MRAVATVSENPVVELLKLARSLIAYGVQCPEQPAVRMQQYALKVHVAAEHALRQTIETQGYKWAISSTNTRLSTIYLATSYILAGFNDNLDHDILAVYDLTINRLEHSEAETLDMSMPNDEIGRKLWSVYLGSDRDRLTPNQLREREEHMAAFFGPRG